MNSYAARPSLQLRRFVVPIVMLVLAFYFAFYMVFGPRGLLALHRMEAKVSATKIERDKLHAQREALQKDVMLMRPSSLDPDMAEEQARKTLGYTRPEEVIIPLE
ncbi:MAG TPA: septum formation initiator family protein [Alphaproteobacteria bacterium]